MYPTCIFFVSTLYLKYFCSENTVDIYHSPDTLIYTGKLGITFLGKFAFKFFEDYTFSLQNNIYITCLNHHELKESNQNKKE